ncbi:FG-GAP-like repeat-containing protein [Conexibacter woesei]|uniref:FG-GAP repeat protein n=1 Tax=Conexibacter woesei (strain DSM 14684 / CCUG 47730 / CIP 108061 / JCM 11494 / NBRC 100937 / ID131577) TaxID=469383 RepID=D3FDA8_CONWI|nr:FG-GAP-like repeat-containing protein [Conexibacter woesei]ADB53500.1 FG-GAP repeat protein [Conexibacter woesei DSM 14684]
MRDRARVLRAIALGAAAAVLAVAVQADAAVTFGAAADYPVGDAPRSLATGDLDGDGAPDLVTADSDASSVSVLLGSGSGVFGARTAYPAGSVPFGVATGEFGGDGRLDVVATDAAGNTLGLLAGDGAGALAAPTPFMAGATPAGVATGDFDGDGDLDAATANFSGANVSVLHGDGAGGFAPAVGYEVGFQPIAIVAADLDGDDDLDLAVANQLTANVSTLLNDGSGTFARPVLAYPAGFTPSALAAGDFDGDGATDLAVVNTAFSRLSILSGEGDGAFAAPVEYEPGAAPAGVASADFDGDGDLDLAVSLQLPDDSAVVILENDGTGAFTLSPTSHPVAAGAGAIVARDLNGDRRPDVAVAGQAANAVSVLLNSGQPAISVTPASLDFGSVAVGQPSASRTVTVTNPAGNAALHVDALELIGAAAGDFAVAAEDCTGAPLLVGDGCTIELRATPTASGARAATLQLAEDAPGEPATVALAIAGVASDPPARPGAASAGPATPAGPPPSARSRLLLSDVSGSPYCLAQAGRRRAGAARDITISYTLSHAAQMTFALQRRARPPAPIRTVCPRRPTGGRALPVAYVDVTTGQLLAPAAKARAAAVAGRPVSVTVAASAGHNSFPLSRLLAGRRPRPGSYRVLLSGRRADGERSRRAAVKFPVLR